MAEGMKAGAFYHGNGQSTFVVWAPEKEKVQVHLVFPDEQVLHMQKDEEGYFRTEAALAAPGTRYFYRFGKNEEYPDPASQYQPEGVHGPSEVVDQQAYAWQDAQWQGLPLQQLIFYELHVGTFTPEGTFEAIIPRLDELKETGINALELMPVTQFPGSRNWGYDSVYPCAVHHSYGGPLGLKKLVDACHSRGMAVVLDLVYNHLGPEGNYFSKYGPYFTDKYSTPWGKAINFEGAWSDGVRDFFAGNALFWFEQYHIDGIRMDAIHEVYDNGAVCFWEYLHEKVRRLQQKLGRPLYLIAESDLNSPRVISHPSMGGFGFDAQWLDDFHHALYVLLHPQGHHLYEDFGQLEQLAKGISEGFVHSGEYVKFRKRKHGASSAGIPGDRFVVFLQNHDLVGNRVKGERLPVLVPFDSLKLAAAIVLLSPYLPMLFMGEEYGEDRPFYYFVSHSDPELVKAVREGRKKEFEKFSWNAEPPDPQSEETFRSCILGWDKRKSGRHGILLRWHHTLIRLRQTEPPLQNFDKSSVQVQTVGQQVLLLLRQSADGRQHLLCLFNLSGKAATVNVPAERSWQKVLDSKEQPWLEPDAQPAQEPLLPANIEAGTGAVTLPPLCAAVFRSV